MPATSCNTGAQYLLISGLCLLLSWPWLALLTLDSASTESIENRRPAPFPELPSSWVSFSKWPQEFSAYVADNLPSRATQIPLQALFKFSIFASSPVPSVLIGKEKWLFHRIPTDIKELQGRLELSSVQSKQLARVLEERQAWLAQQNIDYLVLIAPTKQTVYPEMLPSWLNASGASSHNRRQRLLEEMQDSASPVKVFDYTKALLHAKRKWGLGLYYRTDTHWTHTGALESYNALSRAYPQWFKPIVIGESPPAVREGNLMSMMGLRYLETAPYPRPIGGFSAIPSESPGQSSLENLGRKSDVDVLENPHGSGVLYVLADSFYGWNQYYLSENFARTISCNTWGSQWGRLEQFPVESITQERPDLVVQQLIENRLDIGRGTNLLAEPNGRNHHQEVRVARLAKLFSKKESASVPYRIQGKHIIVQSGVKTKGAYIVQIDALLRGATQFKALSGNAGTDSCEQDELVRGEMDAFSAKADDNRIYLVATADRDGVITIECVPADKINVSNIALARLEL